MIKVGVFGANGRVGKLLIDDLKVTNGMSLSSVFVRNSLNFSIDPSVLVTKEIKTLNKYN